MEARGDPPTLVTIGLDHARADVGVRERFQPSLEVVAAFYDSARVEQLDEIVLVATCNRIEIHAGGGEATLPALRRLLRTWLGMEDAAAFLATSRTRVHREAVDHLMRVAAGLDSQIIGDIHILGQIKRCFQTAERAGHVGPVLHRVFNRVFRAGKRVRSETGLMAGRASYGTRAADVAYRWAGVLAERPCVVVGCGKTGSNAARALVEHGARRVFVTNRTAARAEAVAAELHGVEAFPFEALAGYVAAADIVITATAAPRPLLHVGNVEACGRERLFVDLSLPRNVDPVLASLPDLTILDLDAPGFRMPDECRDEANAIVRAETVVAEESAVLMEWLDSAPVREALRPLEQTLGEICRREIGFAAGSEVAERTSARIVAKFMARPMVALRDGDSGVAAQSMLDAVSHLFRRP